MNYLFFGRFVISRVCRGCEEDSAWKNQRAGFLNINGDGGGGGRDAKGETAAPGWEGMAVAMASWCNHKSLRPALLSRFCYRRRDEGRPPVHDSASRHELSKGPLMSWDLKLERGSREKFPYVRTQNVYLHRYINRAYALTLYIHISLLGSHTPSWEAHF